MKKSDRALNSSASNVSNATKKVGGTMRRNLTWVALMGAPLAILILVGLAACGMDDNPETPCGVSLEIKAKAPECAAAHAPNCAQIQFCVQHVVNPQEAVNPTVTGSCIPLSLTSGEATGKFDTLPEPGAYTLAFKDLPNGFHVKYTTGGFMTDDVIELSQCANALSVVLGTDVSGVGGSGGSAGTGGTGGGGTGGGGTGGGGTGGGGTGGTGGDAGAGGAVNATGGACFKVSKDGQAQLGCTFDWLQLPNDPAVAPNPPPSCVGPGNYYFAGLSPNEYDVAVTCSGITVGAEASITAGNTQTVNVVFPPTPVDGDLCVRKFGLPIDLDTSIADMGQWLGYGANGSCVAATSEQLALMSVTDFSQTYTSGTGTCANMQDASCPIQVNGLVVSMTNGFASYADDEERVFKVVVTDGSSSTDVHIDTLKGYFQP